MTNSTLDITQTFDRPQKLLRILDNSDGTYSLAAQLASEFGAVNSTPMRDLRIAEPYRVAGAVFGAAIDAVFWTVATSGTGAASGVASSIATLSSGTSNNGYGQLQSARVARYIFAHPLHFRAAVRLTALTVANNTRRWGAFSVSTNTPQNGVYFEVDAAGALSVCHVSGAGTPVKVASGSFNGAVTTYTMDTNVHAYDIVYFTIGVWFYIDGVLIHTITPTTSVLFQSLDVPICMTSVNSASGTASGTLECWNAIILRLGRDQTMPRSVYQSGTTAGLVLKIGSGAMHQIVISGVVNNSAITLYDNTAASGTVLWSSGAMGALTEPFNVDLHEVPFFTGLTLVIAAANSVVTVVYE
jgi:hypothetical protein